MEASAAATRGGAGLPGGPAAASEGDASRAFHPFAIAAAVIVTAAAVATGYLLFALIVHVAVIFVVAGDAPEHERSALWWGLGTLVFGVVAYVVYAFVRRRPPAALPVVPVPGFLLHPVAGVVAAVGVTALWWYGFTGLWLLALAVLAALVLLDARARHESPTGGVVLVVLLSGIGYLVHTLVRWRRTHAADRPADRAITARPRRIGESIVFALLFVAAVISVLTTVGIVLSLIFPAVEFFGEAAADSPGEHWSDFLTGVPVVGDFLAGLLEFATGTTWDPRISSEFGVLPLLNGTFLITGIALLVAVPLGLGTAIFLSEYAPPRVRRTVKPVIELLAGIPTIVFGYFALTFFAPEFLNDVLRLELGTFSALSAGIVMGFMVIPTIASVSEDALSAVPQSLREGAYGLGASKVQVALRVVFPAALSGIVAAVVLGVSRAVGETMIVLVAAGLAPNTGIDPRPGYETMTTYIGATARGDIPTGSLVYKTVFAVGITLFLVTFVMNLLSIRFVRRYRQVYE